MERAYLQSNPPASLSRRQSGVGTTGDARDESATGELKTYPPFPPGTLVAPPTECLPYISANEAMGHFLGLRKRLNELQHRLGTPLETCADLDEARTITHTLWNYVQVKWLWAYLGTGRPTAKMFEPGNLRNEVV